MQQNSGRNRSDWFTRPDDAQPSRVKLFCIPYAGGGASIYCKWGTYLPGLTVLPVRLPGRETRIREEPMTNLSTLVDSLVWNMLPEIDSAFAIYGHSMGAIIGYEVVQRLSQDFGVHPQVLFVSGRKAPHLTGSYYRQVSSMTDAEFIEELHELNPQTGLAMANPSLRRMLLPVLRADFALCGAWSPNCERLIEADLVGIGGTEDETTPEKSVMAWQQHCAGRFSYRRVEGGHFFIDEQPEKVCRIVAEELAMVDTFA